MNQTFVGLAFLEPDARACCGRLTTTPRRIEKLTRINEALIQRLERMDDMRGSSYALTRTAAMLEREIVARNADLERALARAQRQQRRARGGAGDGGRGEPGEVAVPQGGEPRPAAAAERGEAVPRAARRDRRRTRCRPTSSRGSPPRFESAEELIRALLDIARLDSQAFEANPGPVAISRLFQRLAIDLQPLAAAARDRPALRDVVGGGAERPGAAAADRAEPHHQRAEVLRPAPKVVVGLKHDGRGRVADGAGRAGRGSTRPTRSAIFIEFERLSRSDDAGERARALDRAARLPAARARGDARRARSDAARASGCGCR